MVYIMAGISQDALAYAIDDLSSMRLLITSLNLEAELQ
jgi:hypothetical protein